MHGAPFGQDIFAYLLILCAPAPAIIALFLVSSGRRLFFFVAAVVLSVVLSGAGLFGLLLLDYQRALPSWMASHGLAVVLVGPVILSALIALCLAPFFMPMDYHSLLRNKRK